LILKGFSTGRTLWIGKNRNRHDWRPEFHVMKRSYDSCTVVTYSSRITAASRSPTVTLTVFPLTAGRLDSCHSSTARWNVEAIEIFTVRAVRVGLTTQRYVPPAP
jgi:hypothetical protein